MTTSIKGDIIERKFIIRKDVARMAQVLKDEIKEKILKAALEEFYDKGYPSAAMRKIAEKAGIPTGLIYTYYKNKDALFEAVLRPVLYDWKQVLSADGHVGPADPQDTNDIYWLSQAEKDCLLNLFDHRREFIILMDKSSGTGYQSEKDRFIGEIEKHLSKHCQAQDSDAVMVHIIANNFVDGLMQLMYHYKGKEWAIMILHKLSKMYLSGIGY